MSRNDRFLGKKVLVTGSGTGIGREIALEFAREGADVVLHYAHSERGAKTAAEEIKAMGRRTAALKANFENVDEVIQLAGQAIDFLGGIHCLVNNAGITFNKPFLKVVREQFDAMFSVNIRAQFFLTQKVVEHMLEHGGGAICNLTSIHGLQGAPEHAVYAGTKGAIIAYTRTLGIELAHKGIRINAIAPGWVMVENHAKIFPGYTEEGAREAAKSTVPLGRPGIPLDIARLALFLCSDDAEYIVGQTIVADGGTTALMSLISDFRHESTARCGLGYLVGV
ncbi:MAG: glucose 1-dehydrogenase [Acidobacteria bacterium]|nr:glucose 1-dehydrogenase [Acidobacteriota bacterium]